MNIPWFIISFIITLICIRKTSQSLAILKKGKNTIDFLIELDEIYDKIIDLNDENLSNEYKNLVTIMKIGLHSDEWIPAVMSYFLKFEYYNLDKFIKRFIIYKLLFINI